ncbi:MAG: chorismate mutase, partial [Kineosporiaceae bacterium]
LHDAALICAQEMWVEGSMPRIVRLLAHVETERPRDAVVNVYLRGTEILRSDVPPIPPEDPAGDPVEDLAEAPAGDSAGDPAAGIAS